MNAHEQATIALNKVQLQRVMLRIPADATNAE